MRHLPKGPRGIDFRLSLQKIMALKGKLRRSAGLAGSLVSLASGREKLRVQGNIRRGRERLQSSEFH